MEGIFHRNVHLKVVIKAATLKTICYVLLSRKDVSGLEQSLKCDGVETGQSAVHFLFASIVVQFENISMLKRSYSMEFDSDHFKSSVTQSSDNSLPAGSGNSVETEENTQSSKKICNSPAELDASPAPAPTRADTYRRYPQGSENPHVTQSRSIFSHEDGFVYGNPKDDIKSIENPSEAAPELLPFDSGSILDLSCKSSRAEDERSHAPDGNTYQNYHRSNFANEPFARSNLEIKLVNPAGKKPSLPEQLQIAKIQQQQRRSIQQQQKMLQQMRRSLDSKASRAHHTNSANNANSESSQGSQSKNAKLYGNSTSNHEGAEPDNHGRVKDDFPPPMPGGHFPQPQYPYFDPAHPKELPDGHPILPLLDPVYFSALYNAHGFLPPSSPSIAAAFIGTLQDALPKLPVMFPSTSSSNSPLLPQKSNDNPN